MRKIAFITTHAPSLIHFRGQLIEALKIKNFVVMAIAPNHNEHTRKWLSDRGVVPIDCSLSRTGLNPVRDTLSVIALARLLRTLKPDVVFSYFIKPVIFGTLAAWLAGIPRRFAMIEGLGFVFTETNQKKSFRAKALKAGVIFLYRVALRFAHSVIFLNKDDAAELIKLGVVKKGQVFQLGGIGVDLCEWPQSQPNEKQITFILVARLLREKGVEYYAVAARSIKKDYPDVRFLLVGGLDENPGSIDLNEVESWVNEGILEWSGHVPAKPFLDLCSVFVLPSYYREGVPLSIQEALAIGRAVITTDSPGCRETVVHGVNGFLVPIHDVSQLIYSMKCFIKDKTLIVSMGQESRNIAKSKFDVHKKTDELSNLIRN